MNGYRHLPCRRRSWVRRHPVFVTVFLVFIALSVGAGVVPSPGVAAPAGAEQLDLEPMSILLMGVDAREGEAIDIGVRPDALAVLRLDPDSGSCRLLNIPRDSRANLPGYGLTKINHALSVGGIPYQELVVEEFLGLPIDRYALIDFGGTEALVDAVGGVTITVTEPFEQNGVVFEVGERTLDGTEALAYASYRGGPDGDFGRIRRQQQLVRAILAKGPSLEPVTLFRELLPQLEDHVRTDLSPLDLLAFGSRFIDTCTDETLVTMNLEGGVATYDDPLLGTPLSYVVISDNEVRRKVEDLIAPAQAENAFWSIPERADCLASTPAVGAARRNLDGCGDVYLPANSVDIWITRLMMKRSFTYLGYGWRRDGHRHPP